MSHHYSMLIATPIYDEEKYLDLALRQLMDEEIPRCVDRVQYLLIDDGSTDRSPEIYREFATAYPDVSYLRHSKQQGYGQAILDAFGLAMSQRIDLLVTYDSDLQHDVRTICNMVQEFMGLDERVAVVSSSRYLTDEFTKGGEIPHLPKDRYLINMLITELLNELTGFHLTDSFCGMKLYKVSELQELSLSAFSYVGYEFPLELFMKWARSRKPVVEIPTPSIYQEGRRKRDDWAERFSGYAQALNRMAWTDEQRTLINSFTQWGNDLLRQLMAIDPDFPVVPFNSFRDILREISPIPLHKSLTLRS